jgi:hypothetical protein
MRSPTHCRTRVLAAVAVAIAAAAGASVAAANTSHAGWPSPLKLQSNRNDESTPLIGIKGIHNELLGGHGNDTIVAANIGDVLWGDYKPSGQPTTQKDTIEGGAGKDYIYASHGTNVITTGGGADQIHAHYGRGSITCASPKATVFLSHRSRPHYKLHGCPRISYKTVGH